MKAKLSKKRKTPRQKQIDRLDKLFSELIRRKSKGYCQRCGRYYGWQRLHCAHFHSRRKLTTRWLEANSCALDAGCHMYLDSHIDAKAEFARQLLGGDKYDELYVLAEMTSKESPVDYAMVEIYLKELLKEVA